MYWFCFIKTVTFKPLLFKPLLLAVWVNYTFPYNVVQNVGKYVSCEW